MGEYVALLRGIGPGNPNMRGEKLREFFQGLGFSDVETVISSGNVVFKTPLRDVKALEDKIERAIPEKLGFRSTTIVRSREEITDLVEKDPFKGLQDTPTSRLQVTFLKPPSKTTIESGAGYSVVKSFEMEICFSVDLTSARTPDVMLKLEKSCGKEITTRSWKTVMRILGRFTPVSPS